MIAQSSPAPKAAAPVIPAAKTFPDAGPFFFNLPSATEEDCEAYARSKEPSVEASSVCLLALGCFLIVAAILWLLDFVVEVIG